jgi:Zn-dependent protease
MRVVNAILAVVVVLAVVVLAFGLDPTPATVVVAACCLLAGQLVHVYAHELGHLAAALWLRFPVTEVAILAGRGGDGARIGGATVRLGLFGSRSEVRVAVPAGRQTTPAQWIAYALAGPVTNLALAAATGLALWVLHGHRPADENVLVQGCLLGVTATGVLLGLANLIPGTSRRGQPTDGRLAVDWLLHPDATRKRITEHLTVIPKPRDAGPSVLAVLRAQVDIGGPAAGEAAVHLVTAALRVGDLSEDAARLTAVARAATTPPQVAAFVAGMVAEVQATMLMVDAARAGQGYPDPGPIADIAELAFARDRHVNEARTALTLIRVLQQRPADARALLAPVDAAGTERSRVNALAVKAIAEADLGDLTQARRLIDAGRRADVPTALLRLATAHVDRAEHAATIGTVKT